MLLVPGARVLDRFVIDELLGSGGMAQVYRANDLVLQRQVAIKLLVCNTVQNKRFDRECQTMASLVSERFPKILSWGHLQSGTAFIVMDLLEGETLQQRMRRVLPTEELVEIVVQICEGLEVAHAQGVVHRDLKPGNIMLTYSGVSLAVKLMDFGIAHLTNESQALTATNEVIGSVGYMSPEHLTPAKLDARSDIFSLGCLMYEAVTGLPPFEGETVFASLLKMQSGETEPLPVSVELWLRSVIAKCLKPAPSERFQNVGELAEALRTKKICSVSERNPKIHLFRNFKLWLAVASCALAMMMILVAASKHKSSKPTMVKGQAVFQLAREIAAVRKDKRVEKIPELIQRLSEQSESWWESQSLELSHDIVLLGMVALQNNQRALGNKAFDMAIDAVQKRHAQNMNKELREILIREINWYMSVYDSDSAVMDKAQRLLKLSKETLDLATEKLACAYIAEICSCRKDLPAASSWYKKSFALGAVARTKDEQIADAVSVVDYCGVMMSLDEPPSIRAQLLASRVHEMQKLVSSDPPLLSWNVVSCFAMLANGLPSSEHSKAFLTGLIELMKLSELRYASNPSAANTFRIWRGVFGVSQDKDGAKASLLESVRMARKLKDPTSLRLAIYALKDNGLLTPEQQLPLLIEACSQISEEPTVSADSGFSLCFAPGLLLAKNGRFDEARKYLRQAVFYAEKHQGGSPKADQDIRLALAQIMRLAQDHKDRALEVISKKEYDRLAGPTSQPSRVTATEVNDSVMTRYLQSK